MLTPLLVLLAIALFIVSVSFSVPIVRLMSIRLRPHRALAIVDPGDLPSDVLGSLRGHGAGLEALGFCLAGALRDEDAVAEVDAPAWSLLYRASCGDAWARLSFSDAPMRAQPVDLAFLSIGASPGAVAPTVFETVAWRLHRLAPAPPEHRLTDARTLDAAEQWAAHRTHVDNDAEAHSTEATPADLAACIEGVRRSTTESEQAAGRLVSRPDGTLRHTLRGALHIVAHANGGEGARLKALAAASDSAAEDADAEVQLEADRTPDLVPELAAHRRREAVEASKPRVHPLRKALLFLVSMLLFFALFGLRFSMETVLLLVVALIVHEAGHAIAMWFFGYRDLQIVFVPFLGAVAHGKKADVAPWQEIVMLLAGPVPGIALGTWLMTSGWADSDPNVFAFANVLIILNYVNLLPILPLDGGKVLSIVLFDRLPTAQLCFSVLSGVAILAGAAAMGEWPIACIGAALLIGVPGLRAQVRTLRRLQSALGRAGQVATDPLRAIYGELRDQRFDRWNSEARYQFVNRMRERLARERAGRSVVALGLAAYVAIWVVPVDAMLDHHVAKEAQAASEQAERQAATPEDRAAAGAADRRATLDDAIVSR